MEAASQASTCETPLAEPRRLLCFVPTSCPRAALPVGERSSGMRCDGPNLESGQTLLQMFRRTPVICHKSHLQETP